MEPNEIIAELKLLGITQTQIAKEAHCKVSNVNNVIHKRSKSKKVEKIISKKLGRDISEIRSKKKIDNLHYKIIKCIYTLIKLPFKKRTVND